MKKILFTFCALVSFAISAYAQTFEVGGTIIDSTYNYHDAGIGIQILNTRTQKTTTSDVDGQYNINVQKGDTLQFSFIGYKTQKVAIDSVRKYNVVLTELETTSGGCYDYPSFYFQKKKYIAEIDSTKVLYKAKPDEKSKKKSKKQKPTKK